MPTGPEHYLRAERLLADVRKAQVSMSGKPDPDSIATSLAQAQIHATLALAAATALQLRDPNHAECQQGEDYEQWRKAASLTELADTAPAADRA